MLSQLGGVYEDFSYLNTLKKMFKRLLPSFIVFMAVIIFMGAYCHTVSGIWIYDDDYYLAQAPHNVTMAFSMDSGAQFDRELRVQRVRASVKNSIWLAFQTAFRISSDYSIPDTSARVTHAFIQFFYWAYRCYILAVIAVREPSLPEHEQLLGNISSEHAYEDIDEIFGPGYIVPKEAILPAESIATDSELPSVGMVGLYAPANKTEI